MKKLLLSALLAMAFIDLPAAAPPPVPDDPYAPGKFALSYFATYRVREFDGVLDRFGSGPELSYSITRNFTIAVEGISENPQHSFFDEGGINGKWYMPIGKSGWSFYPLLGYTYRFEDLPGGTVTHRSPGKKTKGGGWKEGSVTTSQLEEDGRSRMNAGVGIELRGKPNGLFGIFTASAFADGRWTHDFETVGHALFRVGGSLAFGK